LSPAVETREREHKGERALSPPVHAAGKRDRDASAAPASEVPYVLPGALLTHLTRNQALDMTLTVTRGSKFTHKKCRFLPVTTAAATAIYDVRIRDVLQTSALTGREKLAIYGSCNRRVFRVTKRPATGVHSNSDASRAATPSSLNRPSSLLAPFLSRDADIGSAPSVKTSGITPDVPSRPCSDVDMEELGAWLQRGGNVDLIAQSPDYCNGCMDCVRTAASFGMTDAVVVTRSEQRQRLRFRTVLETPTQVFNESIDALSKRLHLLQSALVRYRTDLLHLDPA
jgi:hypothetical protein